MRALLLAALAATACLIVSAAASAATAPNPCTVVPASTVAAVFQKSSAPPHHVSTRAEGPGRAYRTCTWQKAKNIFTITTGPSFTSGGYGGPPGFKLVHVQGLGPQGVYAYDDNPRYRFANVSFTHGSLSGDVNIRGNLPFSSILSIARTVYAAE